MLNPSSLNLVTGGEHFQHLAEYFATLHMDLPFSFHYQKDAGGIAQALGLVECSIKDNKFAVIF
jgi:dTDP-glucose pyrophosphorylase